MARRSWRKIEFVGSSSVRALGTEDWWYGSVLLPTRLETCIRGEQRGWCQLATLTGFTCEIAKKGAPRSVPFIFVFVVRRKWSLKGPHLPPLRGWCVLCFLSRFLSRFAFSIHALRQLVDFLSGVSYSRSRAICYGSYNL